MAEQKNDRPAAAPVAGPPRGVGGKARRRSWGEPRVRIWWVAAAVLLMVGGYLVVAQIIRSAADRGLIRSGVRVEAEVVAIDGAPVRGKPAGPELNRPFTLRYMAPGTGVARKVIEKDLNLRHVRAAAVDVAATRPADGGRRYLGFTGGPLAGVAREIVGMNDGMYVLDSALPRAPEAGEAILVGCEARELTGRLKDQTRALSVGEMPQDSVIPIYVDNPASPTQWTDRGKTDFVQDALVGIMLLPIIVVMLVVAVAMRRGVLRVWRDGAAMAVVVVDSRQSAIAPSSRVVRFTLRDARDQRVYQTLVPGRVGTVQRGDVLWVIAMPGRADRAIVAELYRE